MPQIIYQGPNVFDAEKAKRCAMAIVSKYPGYSWDVECRDGVVNVLCPDLSTEWGFFITERDMDTDYKNLISMAGGLLEQFGVGQRFSRDEVAALPRDFAGRVILQ